MILFALAMWQSSPPAPVTPDALVDPSSFSSISLAEKDEQIELDDCPATGMQCVARIAILQNETNGICVDNVVPQIRFRYLQPLRNGAINYAVPVDIFEVSERRAIRSAVVAVQSAGINKVCISIVDKIIPSRNFSVRPSTIKYSQKLLSNFGASIIGSLVSGTVKRTNPMGALSRYDSTVIDYIFGRSSNTLRRIKIRSADKAIPIFRGEQQIGVTEEELFIAESALADVSLKRGNTRFSIFSCRQPNRNVFEFVC